MEAAFPKTPLGGTAVGPTGIPLPRDSSGSFNAQSEAQRTDLSESDFPKTTLSGAAVGPQVAVGGGEVILRFGSGRSPLAPTAPGGP